jgi:beta-lactam-binding protein with PASTA domain
VLFRSDLGHVPSSPGSDGRAPTTPVAVAEPAAADDTVPVVPAMTRPAPAPTPTLELSTAGRRRRRWPIVLLVVLLLAAGGAAGAWALVQARVPSHPVPDTVNRPEAEAVAAVQALGFEVRVQRAFVNGTTAGQVTAQDPAANTELKEGRTVILTVSQGPVPVPMPDLSGMDRNAAVQAIQNGSLTVGKVTSRHDEQAPEGRVLDWAPKGGMAPTGSPVDLTLSSGPAPRVVPDLQGQSYEAAAAALGRQGLKAARADDHSDTVPQGQVIGTNPTAGEALQPGRPGPASSGGRRSASWSRAASPRCPTCEGSRLPTPPPGWRPPTSRSATSTGRPGVACSTRSPTPARRSKPAPRSPSSYSDGPLGTGRGFVAASTRMRCPSGRCCGERSTPSSSTRSRAPG